MSLVVNNIVKMEWEKNRWLETAGTKQVPACFILGAKEYETANDVVCVFFRSTCAWVFEDSEGLYSFADVKGYVKDNMDGSFPEGLEEFVPLYSLGDANCDMDKLERFGLSEFAEDIKARVNDLAPYGEEQEVKMG